MKNTLEMMFNAPFTIHEKSLNLYIDLEQILKHGTFHGVRRYSHVNTLASMLPKPDYIDYESTYNGYDCELIYGDIGVYISGNKVKQIEIMVDVEDGFIDGGKDCEVNYWEFEEVDELTLLYVTSVLANENLDYTVEHDPDNDEYCTVKIEQSGVTLGFMYDGYNDDYMGASFYKLESITV